MGRRASCSSYMPAATSKMGKANMQSALEAVSEMLAKSLITPQAGEVTMTYIQCAKILLDKTIHSGVEEFIPATVRVSKPDVDYTWEVYDKNLIKISFPDGRELDDETMIDVDGVAMEYSKAKGKPIKTGRVL